MTRTSRLATILSIGSALALGTLAHAQAGGPPATAPGAPAATAPGAAGTTGGATVTNAGTDSSTMDTISTSTTTTDPNMITTDTSGTGTLPNTGGEPLVMVLGGIALAGSALVVRRKLA